jgi:putative ABC transport system permease protein
MPQPDIPQPFAQQLEPAMKIHPDRSGRQARSLRDFRTGHPFHEAEHHRLAIGLRQATQGAEGATGFEIVVLVFGHRRLLDLFLEIGALAGAPDGIDAHVPSDSCQPAPERADIVEGRQPLKGAQEDFLHDVVRILRSKACERDAMDHPGVAFVQALERRAVASPGGRYQAAHIRFGLVFARHLVSRLPRRTVNTLTKSRSHRLFYSGHPFGAKTMSAFSHEAWGRRWIGDLVADTRYGVRQFWRHRAATVVCIATLAIGIGANVAMFSTVYTVLLRPLPFKDPSRLVLVSEYWPGNVAKTGSPFARYQERVARTHVFTETAAYWDVSGGNGLVFDARGSAERLQASFVTSSFFSTLGIEAARGRTFLSSEDAAGQASVFIASDALWRRQLGGDPAALGRTYRLDGQPRTLVGVMPAGFQSPPRCDVWMPVGVLGPNLALDRVSHQFWMIGRLASRVEVTQAQAELDGVQRNRADAYPTTDANWRVRAVPLLDELVGNVRTSLGVLLGAVAFVLLIACTNVTNLLLARASDRAREFSIRGALGASSLRLVRQTFTESLLLASAGTVLALALAGVALRAIATLGAGSIPRLDNPQLTAGAFAAAAAVAILTTVVVGLAPGIHASRAAISESLQASQRSGLVTRRSAALGNALVVCEVALTLVLLTGAGLMLRSLGRLQHVDPGFNPARLMTAKIALPDAAYPQPEQRAAFLRDLLERLNAAPGIEMAAAADRLPLSGETNWGGINIVGRPVLDSAHAPSVEGRAVSANYFRAVRIPLLRGREFTDGDVAAGRSVVVINQTMARQFWRGEDPIGQHITSPYRPMNVSEVVGVVGDVKDFALDADSPPEMYSPYRWWNEMNLVLRSPLDEAALLALVRRHVAALDPGVPVYNAARLGDLVNQSMGRQHFDLQLLGLFALVGLALAAVGIYGVLSGSVSRRVREIGVRMALGAVPRQALVLVVAQGMKLVVFGLGLGGLAALSLMRVVRALLFQISPADPVTFAAVAAILALVGGLACSIPGWRAMRLDPIVALRRE